MDSDSPPQTTKIRKDIFLYKVGLPITTGLVQQPVQIVVCYRSHNLTLFVMSRYPKHNKIHRYFTMRKLGLVVGFFTGGSGSSPSLSS